jgi:hypothetical protein
MLCCSKLIEAECQAITKKDKLLTNIILILDRLPSLEDYPFSTEIGYK